MEIMTVLRFLQEVHVERFYNIDILPPWPAQYRAQIQLEKNATRDIENGPEISTQTIAKYKHKYTSPQPRINH